MLKINEEKFAKLESKVHEKYEGKFTKSKHMHQRACNSFLGGVSGAMGFWRPFPLYLTHGKGGKIYDLDGNELIDTRMGMGAILLGHAHPEVVEAIQTEISRGLLLNDLELGVEVAELIKEIAPCAEKVRFRNTGTEAVMAAITAARGFTGKDKFVKFYGVYHGVFPDTMVGWQSHTLEPSSGGIPKDSLANTVVLPWNDIEAVRRKLDEDPDIGTIITDSILSIGGIFPPTIEYFQELRQLTKERGIILILDEVLTGFRLDLGGAQEYFGITPDLAAYGKAIAGGTPLAALAGRDDIMSVLGGTRSSAFQFGTGYKAVFQSGTMNDNTAGSAAGISSMKALKRLKKGGEYKKLNERSSKYFRQIEGIFERRGIPCHVNSAGSHSKVHFTDEEPTYDVVCRIDKRLFYLFNVALMTNGVLLASPSSGSNFVSFATTDEDLANILGAIEATLNEFDFAEILESDNT